MRKPLARLSQGSPQRLVRRQSVLLQFRRRQMQSERTLPRHRAGVALRYLSLILIALTVVLCPAISFAHPMGNFSISHYSGITIEGDSVDVLYLIDMAEIPTFQEMQEAGLSGHLDDP